MCSFVSLFLVVSNSAVKCLERLVSEMTYYVSSEALDQYHTNSTQLSYLISNCWKWVTHDLTHLSID